MILFGLNTRQTEREEEGTIKRQQDKETIEKERRNNKTDRRRADDGSNAKP